MEDRRRGTPVRSILICFCAALTAPSLIAVAAEPALTAIVEIAMQSHQGYSGEHCVMFGEGRNLTFAVATDYPVDFNIHHHTDTATDFPLKTQVQRVLQGKLSLDSPGEYCFMWTNLADHDSGFTIRLEYTATVTPSL